MYEAFTRPFLEFSVLHWQYMSCVKAPSCFVWKAQCTFKIKGIAVWDASTQLHITHPYMILRMLFLYPNFKPRDHNRFYIRLQKTNITKMMFKRNFLRKFDVIIFQVMLGEWASRGSTFHQTPWFYHLRPSTPLTPSFLITWHGRLPYVPSCPTAFQMAEPPVAGEYHDSWLGTLACCKNRKGNRQ